MTRKITFTILLFLLVRTAHAQQAYHTYTLTGTMNSDTGQVVLCSIGDDSYYPYKSTQETNAVNGKFIFTDSIDYPTPYRILLRKNSEPVYVSGLFYVDSGPQTISCNVDDSLRETPKIINRSMEERSLWNESSIVVLQYAKEHPESYMVLWRLVEFLRGGYKPIYDSIYNELSHAVRNTHTGLLLAKKLRSTAAVAMGRIFPSMSLKNIYDSTIILSKFNKTNGYTLIDFWFSHCYPCKRQFPAFKKMYDKYKDDGFEIIGISVDQADAINDWKKVIKDLELDWPQYRDKDLKNANAFSIGGYPKNFLLDKTGTIVKRDIKPAELEKMLSNTP